MAVSKVVITEKGLDFARDNIMKYGESNFVFPSFEYEVIFNNYEEVKKDILGKDAYLYPDKKLLTYSVPKPNGKFRIVQQLDPIDLLVLTALIYEIAEKIEEARIPIVEGKVFSYRIKKTTNSFFDHSINYSMFMDSIESYSHKYAYCLKVDFVDFYNQIYLHRVENALTRCDVTKSLESGYIESFLTKLNNGVSQGIPVGPEVTHVLAEAIMIDVDEMLSRFRCDYVRYADDIYIFSDKKSELLDVLSDFTEYMYNSHRLSLSSEKTEIMTARELQENYDSPAKRELSAIHFEIVKMNEKLFDDFEMEFEESNSPYFFGFQPEFYPKNFEELTKKEQYKINEDALKNLFIQNLQSDNFQISIHRHILNKCKFMRSKVLVPIILEDVNFVKSISAIRINLGYIISLIDDDEIYTFIKSIESILLCDYSNTKYFKEMLSRFISNYTCFRRSVVVEQFMDTVPLRNRLLYAMNKNDLSFVRQYKDKFEELGDWDRRALIYSSKIIPKKERKFFFKYISRRLDFLENTIVSHIKVLYD